MNSSYFMEKTNLPNGLDGILKEKEIDQVTALTNIIKAAATLIQQLDQANPQQDPQSISNTLHELHGHYLLVQKKIRGEYGIERVDHEHALNLVNGSY